MNGTIFYNVIKWGIIIICVVSFVGIWAASYDFLRCEIEKFDKKFKNLEKSKFAKLLEDWGWVLKAVPIFNLIAAIYICYCYKRNCRLTLKIKESGKCKYLPFSQALMLKLSDNCEVDVKDRLMTEREVLKVLKFIKSLFNSYVDGSGARYSKLVGYDRQDQMTGGMSFVTFLYNFSGGLKIEISIECYDEMSCAWYERYDKDSCYDILKDAKAREILRRK